MLMAVFRLLILAGPVLSCPLETRARSAGDAEKPTAGVESPCLRSRIRFDVSSVEKIILNPEAILEDPERFWKEDKAYQLLAGWHDRIQQPPDLEKWRRGIEKLRDLPKGEREKHPQLVAATKLAGIEKSFVARATPYLCSFLPPEADPGATIYFTTEMISAGFAEGGSIVVHILNHEVHNLFVHELFHRGMGSLPSLPGDPQRSPGMTAQMYWTLYFEGLATYVGYAGRKEFPQIGKIGQSLVAGDYDMLDRPEEVRRLHSGLGRMFREAGSMDPDALRDLSWEFGVNQRAYYVVGAHMARTIDENLGRGALIETLVKGPRAFLDTYNDLVEEDWKVPEIR